MIDSVTLQPVFPLWIIAVASISLFSWLVWNEYKRMIKFLLWRLVAVIIVSISILGLILQPSWQIESGSNGMVLLTPHYETKTVDSLVIANPSLVTVRTMDAEPYGKSELISSLNKISNLRFVVGDGLPDYSLEVNHPFSYLKSKMPYGIIRWTPPTLFRANQQNEITGLFYAKEKTILKLMGPSGVEDSTSFSKEGIFPFTFHIVPKQTGLFLYSIESKNDSESSSQKFPVEVLPERKLKIFISVKYPTAEVRYLKNFLAEKGNSVIARFQVSKNNYRYEYSNTNEVRINSLSIAALKSFDLIVVDNESIEALSSLEQNQLLESVRQGLGLLIVYNSITSKSTNPLQIPFKNFKSDTARIRLASSYFTFPTLPATVDSNAIESIIQNKERILAGYLNKGAGKIGFQSLQETYRLQLEGRDTEYAILWTPIIEQVAKRHETKSKIELEQSFPIYTDEPITVNVISSEAAPKLFSNSIALPLREDVIIDDYWHGTTWADGIGWHAFSIQEDSIPKNYYVSNRTEWQSLRIAQQQRANSLASQSKKSITKAIINTERESIPQLLFYLLFLISAGFLWLVPKL